MEPATWNRVKEIYGEALERPEDERTTFIDAAAGEDDELRREVLELLAANEEVDDAFLSDTAVTEAMEVIAAADAGDMQGRRVGAYRIVSKLGQGGMGAVYLAERAAGGFAQQVAVKVLHGATARAEVTARFGIERQILAGLDHPHIARLLDGGATGDGLPYFVMEYVEGVPIDRYCDERRLGVDERVELFLTVCEAVQHAHRNLVVHRDIKPSNVLVTGDGSPKLLDFGIAKLLRPDDTFATRTAMPMLTPGYASPEQMHGRPVTTASDVFSLGVLLYELLTAARPYEPRHGRSLPELAWHMENQAPTRPSSLASADEALATARRTTPAGLRRRLAGDLDAIVLKALRYEPEQRYPSVEALVQDLVHERRGLPVSARRGSLAYRAGKFARRYRTAVAATVLVVLSLTGGIFATLWQARTAQAARQRAERRFNDVRKLAHALLFDYHDAIAALPGSTAARALMVDGALEYLDSLAHEAAGDVDLQRELAAAYERVGDIQGRPNTANLGDLDAALASYRKALAIRRELEATAGESPALEAAIATNLHRIGDVLWWNGDTRGALEHFERGREIRLRLADEEPEAWDLRLDLASSWEAIGDVEMWNGEPVDARDKFERALGLLRQVAAARGEDEQLRRRIGDSLCRIGEAHGWTGDEETAVATLGEALAILEPLAAKNPTDAEIGQSLVVAYLRLAENQAETPEGGALATYRKALARIEALSEADPNDARARRLVAVARSRVGDTLKDQGEPVRALDYYRGALKTWDSLVAEYPANASHRRDRAVAHRRIGEASLAAGRFSAAIELLESSVDSLSELIDADPQDTALLRDLALSYQSLGDALARQAEAGRAEANPTEAGWQRARESYQRALDTLTELDRRGALAEYDRQELESLANEIDHCDQALSAR